MKNCRTCGLDKDQSAFGFDKYAQDGRNGRCKECLHRTRKQRNFVAVVEGRKSCMHCRGLKHVSEFGKNKGNYDGLHVWCRQCARLKAKEYRQKNPEKYEEEKRKSFVKWREKLGIDPSIQLKNKPGEGHITRGGYLTFHKKGHPCADKGGRVQASHLVMYERIGRRLHSHESVHHKNGDRLDNRIENLELWTTDQPPGTRVKDKISWSKKFLEQYGYEVRKIEHDDPSADLWSSTT